MRPSIASLPEIDFDCADEEIFIFLEKMAGGYPLPGNVITDVNPYNYPPSNLPDGIWYLIHSKENGAMEFGCWKVKGEACKLFSNSDITGWRTTLEFFERQVHHECKTDWVMQEYWITQKGPGENSKLKEASSLCRVFLGGEQGLDHKKQQKVSSLHNACENLVHSTKATVPKARDDASNGSTSKPEVDGDAETGNLAVAGEPPFYLVGNPPEIDYISRGDFLELLDLDNPASPSSSSDDSSCLTSSSDECFDSLALLQELDSEINWHSAQKNESCKFSVSASFRPNEVVMAPISPGTSFSIEESKPPTEELVGTNPSVLPTLANDSNDLDNRVLQHTVRNHNADNTAGGPSNSSDVGTSSSCQLPSRDGKRKVSKLRTKKHKKYLCFIPFSFLF
ncbi:NAC domain-containing protein 89 [Manihot esculenta]|uniref:NAC transcription factors 12 n=1 Tax=Manihot esculenta TaxID=3983 RepID=A0A0M4FLN5_MANES|nr:NAC domain-containing protein 89 [Manihot esculenta]XP_043812921.1 NAC domain-containing protein 89 [Manihot esculenta]ALC78989.1 NAC transcription factors 12 [Manihot esculenta]OAY50795.1 hypothetical protein MANES_05G163200v8 [Manihot esculenta]